MDSVKEPLTRNVVELQGLTLRHAGRPPLLEDAGASLRAGTLTALIGRNGTGKSTLLRTIAGLSAPDDGRILLCGEDTAMMRPERRARLLAFVNTRRLRIANMTCLQAAAMGRAPHTDWLGRLRPADREAVDHALLTVGLRDFASRTIDTLSDGEYQRVMIARALAQDTPALLLDEPTSFLDIPNRHKLVDLLADLAHNEGKCIIMSTHELDLALSSADTLALLCDSHLALLSPAAQDTRHILSNAFGIKIT